MKFLNKLKKINLSKSTKIFFLSFVILGLFVALPVSAAPKWVTDVVGGLLGIFVSMLAWILVQIVSAVIYIASWSTYVDASAVSFGWTVVRDICNMFFIVFMLIMALGTILNLEKFNYKKILPKLILMAILINFSKTICGLFIDLTQVIMMTFVASFSTFGAGSLIDNLGITDIVKLSSAEGGGSPSLWTVLAAYLMGMLYVIIAIVVCVAMLAMLAMRIVMIWIYVVLSPLAYLLGAFPPGQKFASQWWSEFTKNLIVGPVLAFFLWLSIVSLQADKALFEKDKMNDMAEDAASGQEYLLGKASDEDAEKAEGATEATSAQSLIKFVIAIGMLVGGLQIASQVGGAAGSMAGKGMKSINSLAKAGAGGVAAVTGARYASGVYKNYQGARNAKRQEKYKDHSMAAAQIKGNVTRNLSPKNWIAKGVGTDRKTKKVEDSMKAKKIEMERKEQNFSQKEGNISFKKDVREGYEFDKKDKTWRKGNDVVSDSDMKQRQVESNQENNYQYDKENKKWVNETGTSSLNDDEMSERVSAEKENYQKGYKEDVEKIGKIQGGKLGFVKNYLKKSFSNADLDISEGYRTKKVQEKEVEYKGMSDAKVEAALDDSSLSAYSRAAASLESFRRGILGREKALATKKKLTEGVGLGGSRNGALNDKKLGVYFEEAFSKTNLKEQKLFEDAKSDDISVREKAKGDIREKFQKREIKIDSMNTSDMKEFAPEIVSGLGVKGLTEEIKSIKNDSKKKEVIKIMQNKVVENNNKETSTVVERENTDFNSREIMFALAKVGSIAEATKNAKPADARKVKEKFFAEIKFNEMVTVFNEGSEKEQREILAAFQDLGGNIEILKASRNALEGNSQNATVVKRGLGLNSERSEGEARGAGNQDNYQESYF